eukprot:11998315-Heterocapsa_arctica.AAC.1
MTLPIDLDDGHDHSLLRSSRSTYTQVEDLDQHVQVVRHILAGVNHGEGTSIVQELASCSRSHRRQNLHAILTKR